VIHVSTAAITATTTAARPTSERGDVEAACTGTADGASESVRGSPIPDHNRPRGLHTPPMDTGTSSRAPWPPTTTLSP